MSSRNKRYHIRLASQEDGDFMNTVLESGDFNGKIGVQFTRRPNPFSSLENEAHRTVLALVIDTKTGQPCGTGCCQVRTTYIGGKSTIVGYLSSMRITPEYQKKLINIADVYGFIFSETPEVDYYYTTILKENTSVIAMLEKPRRRFPAYNRLGEYTVYCLSPNLKLPLQAGYRVSPCSRQDIRDYLVACQQEYNLSTVDLLDESSCWFRLTDSGGETLGICALADQRDYKQYVVTHYRGLYRLLPWLPTVALGYPRLPKAGNPANYASLHSLYVKEESLFLLPAFISAIVGLRNQYDFYMVGALAQTPENGLLAAMKHVKYQSYLYEVKTNSHIDLAKIRLDVGLL